MQINDHYLKLAAGYLFPEIARRVNAFTEANADALKDKPIIKLGIGDVTEPLPEACRTAMIRAVNEMGKHDQFRGYGPEQGYDFLREAIAAKDYQQRGCDIDADEVFVSDGSKCDSANLLDILGPTNTTAVCDPVYPVYVDTNVMAGHTGPAGGDGRYGGLVYLPMTAENGFTPPIPDEAVDVVYLCSPNNPTGAAMTHDQLAAWVTYANENKTLILFDAAYAAFIQDDTLPRSIYEVPGAKTCAIEFRSFSKTAGFTGTRCAYTVVPKELMGKTSDGDDVALHGLWSRRQSTKFNGVSYIVQRGAEAIYTDEGKAEVAALVAFYMENAKLIREGLVKAGITTYGGEHAPYVWVKAPEGTTSWDLFDRLLNEAHVVGTPGAGFGSCGEGYFRLSAFNSRENVETAIERVTAGVAV
ncbi:MAG: LL-diaminopimelate aminotransferase [Planctomycetota bacterium]